MNYIYYYILISILGFQIFQFFFFISIIRNILNSLKDKAHELFKKEILEILNDKELYDNIKDYAYSIVSNILQRTQNKNSSSSLTQIIIQSLLNRFIPPVSENNEIKEIKNKNPFTK